MRDAPPDSAANLFLDAPTRETIPLIEANYRTAPSDRCLYGYSSNGARPAARDATNPIQLYLSAGELDDDQFPYFHQLVAFLERGNYPDLTLTAEIYPGEGHGSEGMALTYLHGLRGVYPRAES